MALPEAEVRTSWLYALARKINTRPSLYLEAGAIHGTAEAIGRNVRIPHMLSHVESRLHNAHLEATPS